MTKLGLARILQGDVRAVLANLRPNTFDCVVTSPPYYGLRAYETAPQVWGGDDPACVHSFGDDRVRKLRGPRGPKSTLDHVSHPGRLDHPNHGAFCRYCGAWRGELGLEPCLGMHLDHLVGIFRQVRRVLKPGGTLWLNYGDCYATSPNGRSAADTKANGMDDRTFRDKPFSTVGPLYVENDTRANGRNVGKHGYGARQTPDGRVVAGGYLKPKDLCMVPNRLAIALQDDGWWIRSEIVWGKRNGMPDSSGRYRPSTAHEKIFMLTKSADHYYDAKAVALPCSKNTHARIAKYSAPTGWDQSAGEGGHGTIHRNGRGAGPKSRPTRAEGIKSNRSFHEATAGVVSTRHLRNYEEAPLAVWPMATQSFKNAHFATFPQELVERCLAAGCPPGGNVLDPFGGSGTVGMVAVARGLDATLVELKPDYCDMAAARIAAAFGPQSLGGRAGGRRNP